MMVSKKSSRSAPACLHMCQALRVAAHRAGVLWRSPPYPSHGWELNGHEMSPKAAQLQPTTNLQGVSGCLIVTKQRARDTLEINADSSDSATSSQGFMLQPPCRRLYFSSCSRTNWSGRGAAGAQLCYSQRVGNKLGQSSQHEAHAVSSNMTTTAPATAWTATC